MNEGKEEPCRVEERSKMRSFLSLQEEEEEEKDRYDATTEEARRRRQRERERDMGDEKRRGR